MNGDDNFSDKATLGIQIYIYSGMTLSNVVFRPMLTLADVEDQTYEPYQGKDITTDLTLRAIEVSSTDDYNLEKDGKYYIADTLDWDDGYKITRRVRRLELNGTEASWESVGTTIEGKYRIVYRDENLPSYADLGVENFVKGCVTSNLFPESVGSTNQPYYGNETIAFHATQHWLAMHSETYNTLVERWSLL